MGIWIQRCYFKCWIHHWFVGNCIGKWLDGIPWEIFPTFFGIIMGRNVASICANLYVAKQGGKFWRKKTKHDPKFIWPKHFQKIHRDSFGITLNTGFQNSTIWWNLLKYTNSNMAQEWNIWIWSYTRVIDFSTKVFEMKIFQK